MNYLTNRLLFCLLFCSATLNLSAQAVIKLDDYILAPGEELDLPVQVTGFTNILGMQFQLEWDPAVLEFVGHSDYNLAGLGPTNFGPAQPVESLKVSWFTFVSNGETLQDDEAVFVVKFKVVGQHQDTTQIAFSSDFPVELIDVNQPLNVTTIDGFLLVDDPNDVQTPFRSESRVSPAFPNPFRLNTQIPFSLEETSPVFLRIYDHQGQLIDSRRMKFPAGDHQLTIDAADLPGPGTYSYQLQTNQYQHSSSFVFFR